MAKGTWTIGFFVLTMILGLMPGPIIPLMTPCALADSFNVKTGVWEVTSTGVASGIMIPPEILERIPPERRAHFEEVMQARSGEPQTHVSQYCLTQQDLDQNNVIKEEFEKDVECQTKIVSQSSSKLVLERTCPAPYASTSQISIVATTPKRVIASVDRSEEGAGKIHVDIKGRWLGASCDEIKQ